MTSAKYDVLGIGNAIFDVLVQTDESFLAAHGMTKGGMALIDEARGLCRQGQGRPDRTSLHP
jgi:adenosine kinase